MICKECKEDKDEKRFSVCAKLRGKEYRVKTCGSCTYKIKKENGKTTAYYQKYPDRWREYQREYTRIKKGYYEKRGLENPTKDKNINNE